jgi:hypothetical protein
LIKVVLTDNNLAGKELAHLASLSQIETLKLGGNKIKTLDELKSLVSQSPADPKLERSKRPEEP